MLISQIQTDFTPGRFDTAPPKPQVMRWPFIALLLLGINSQAWADALTLEQTLALLEDHNPALASAQASRSAAEAALVTARQFPNPEMEIGGGSSTGIGQGAYNGQNDFVYLAQPLDLPFVREARSQVAEAGIESAEQANRAVWLLVRAQTKQAFYQILRRKAELRVSEDNERLLQQIHNKVALKVEVGEASRYELVKADAELLNAVNLKTRSTVQIDDAKSALRNLFAGALPIDFDAAGELPSLPDALMPLDEMRSNVRDRQPLLQQIRAQVKKAQSQLELEQNLRFPVPTLKAGGERDPGLEQWRVSISVPLPIWHQRQGQIAEAEAELRRLQAEVNLQELKVVRELENAYNRYQIADRQVNTFEDGLLLQAEKALQVAEAGYRLGERGILDYLDAQRVYRNVRNDYLNALFDRQDALTEIEKLNVADL
ncbi:MAG: TolC family protein [Methylomonas sp.]|nr:TolC family protein [Methylomonas sp.]